MPILQREFRLNNIEHCREKEREHYHDNKEYYKQKRRIMYEKHKEKRIAYSAEYRANNKESVDEKRRIFMRKHNQKEEVKAQRREYCQQDHVKNIKRCAVKARKLSIKRRVPPWADLKAIREFYKNRPDGYHVDHIIPLNGNNVSGLHVLENLQYLSAKKNLLKSNKYIPTAAG